MSLHKTALLTVLTLLSGLGIGLLLPAGAQAGASAGWQEGSLELVSPMDGAAPSGMGEDLAFATSLSRVFRHASTAIKPSVVHIQRVRRVTQVRRDMFGRIVDREDAEMPSGVGSGVIVTEDGYALTNHHVIAGADEVRVTLADGTEVPADVVGSDPGTDLAVLKLQADGLTPARLADSDALQVGDWVVAVGSPFGLDHTVTAGIVSAKGRQGLGPRTGRVDRFEEFIQTDAAINPGNSGGPLVNLRGEVVGINSMIASSSGGSNGVGFAIPSAIAVSVFNNIRENGRLEQGYLGIELSNSAEVAAQTGRDLPEGAFVEVVIDGSPADEAGLRPGDVIVAINGRRTQNFNRLRNQIGLTPPGTPVTLRVSRDGRELELAAEVTSMRRLHALRRQADREALERAIESRSVEAPTLGVRGVSIDEGVPSMWRGMPEAGVLVVQVEPDSPASVLNLRTGDVIIAIDDRVVETTDQLLTAMREADLRRGVTVTYVSGGIVQRAAVRLRD